MRLFSLLPFRSGSLSAGADPYGVVGAGVGNDDNCEVNPNGYFGVRGVDNVASLRPSVSLKPGTEITGGAGLKTDPYIIE